MPEFSKHRFGDRRARRGVALVEMVAVLSLVLLFAFGTVDFGRVIHAYLAVSNAARAGAGYGSMHKFTEHTRPFWESQVRLAVERDMEGFLGFSAENLETTISTTTDGDGLFQLTVDVAYPFETIVDWPGIPADVPLGRRVVMRQIR